MKIVIVADPNRRDFYNYIVDHLEADHELSILWHYTQPQVEPLKYRNCSLLYWKNYLTPRDFLTREKPDRILFFEIIDFWQISLVIACHRFKILSFFVEHGVGSDVTTVISRFKELPSLKERTRQYLTKIVFKFHRVIRNRIFFFAVFGYLSAQDKLKCIKMLSYYKRYTPIHSLSLLRFRLRTPHYAILFNRNNINSFLLYNEIEQANVLTPGVPFFDKYFTREEVEQEHIVFIEHPYLESGLLNWDDTFHEKVARTIESFAVRTNTNIVVKLHPLSDFRNWARYKLDSLVSVKQHEDVTNELLTARLVLGYSSTLISALILARKNVVLLGWHPQPQIFGDDLSRTGLCHLSFALTDFADKYDYWVNNNCATQNLHAFQAFIEEYNSPFDGLATERVIRAILENEVS